MITLRAPGRITLFGEHQDYLNYPVISMAISKYIYLRAKPIAENKFTIKLKDLNQYLEIVLNNRELEYHSKRDYLRSGYNQVIRKGIKFNKGYEIEISGDIPMNAGAASSSALVIVWLYFLYLVSNHEVTSYELALEGYNAEVKEFGESGGKMDFFTSAFGGLLYQDLRYQNPMITPINVDLEGLVLGHSLEKKETVKDLRRTKLESIKAFNSLKEIMPAFNRFTSSLDKINNYLPSLRKAYQEKIIGNLINRDLTEKAQSLLLQFKPIIHDTSQHKNDLKYFYKNLGPLIYKHHIQLRDNIKISTEKIDKMIEDCLEAGAYGGKINGSGFGGTMFVISSGKEKKMSKSIEKNNGKPYLIQSTTGVTIY